jgi:hypothetical protein
MNANISSVQDVIRDGEKLDIYYYSKQNLFIQSRPTVRNNKFVQALTSANIGTNQFIFSPDQGFSDLILIVELLKESELPPGISYVNYALSRGWMYSLLQNVAVRYGGSSQYFFDSSQIALMNAVDMQDAPSRDTLFRLAGEALMGNNPLSGSNDFSVTNYGYLYLNLPHNTPNGDGLKMAPLPTELLRQPVLVQVNLNNSRSIFSSNGTATSPLMGANVVKSANFQAVQVRMVDSANLLTNEEDPNKITYVYPLKYFQQQVVSTVLTTGEKNNVNITGFRNGSVRSIILWCQKLSDIQPAQTAPRAFNDNNWYAPRNTVLSINGEIFDVSIAGSSQLLNLVNNKQASELAMTQYELGPAPASPLIPVVGGFTATYLKVDFSQHSDPVTSSNLLVGGKSITNSIVNFQCDTPDGGVGWRLYWVSLYNSSLIFSQGNCEYSF